MLELEPPTLPEKLREAAFQVLDSAPRHKPQHHTDIAKRALALGLISVEELGSQNKLYTLLQSEISRDTKLASGTSRFINCGDGKFGLTKWIPQGLAAKLMEQNEAIEEQLRARLVHMPPRAFEDTIRKALEALGCVDISKPQAGFFPDDPITYKATLRVHNLLVLPVWAQAHRKPPTVGKPFIEHVQTQLSRERAIGIVLTTDKFSLGASQTAQSSDIPIALLDGEDLVQLLADAQIGIHHRELIEYQLEDESL